MQNRSIQIIFIGSLVIGLLVLSGANRSNRAAAEVTAVSTTGDNFLYLPTITKNYDGSLGTPIFGLQMYGATGSSNPYHPYLLDSNASWLRSNIGWASVEPVNVTPDAYYWSSVDASLNAARSDMGGLNLIVTIDTAPDWAVEVSGDPNQPIDSEDLAEFAQFMGALAERYDGDGVADAPESPVVLYWELYNEPDRLERWGEHGVAYANMLAAVYPAVKAANSRAQVVMGGISYDWFTTDDLPGPFVELFLDDVLSSGGGAYFDVMNFHYYPAFRRNWTSQGPGLLEKTNFIRNKLISYGYNHPIVITEAGWHSNGDFPPESNHQEQISYLVELFTQSMAADVDVMIWWLLYDIGEAYPYENGLVINKDLWADPPTNVEKPSFPVFQNIVAELSTAHFKRKLSLSETGNSDMEVYLFNDKVYGRDIYVAWLDPIDTTATAVLKLPFVKADVRNIETGVVTTLYDHSDGKIDGKVTISVSRKPVYVEVDR